MLLRLGYLKGETKKVAKFPLAKQKRGFQSRSTSQIYKLVQQFTKSNDFAIEIVHLLDTVFTFKLFKKEQMQVCKQRKTFLFAHISKESPDVIFNLWI